MKNARQVNTVYQLAKNDMKFRKTFNELTPEDPIEFKWIPDMVHKATVATLYYGYVVGIKNKSLAEVINKF